MEGSTTRADCSSQVPLARSRYPTSSSTRPDRSICGSPGATQFDAIQSDAAGSLNGTLNVALQGGFVPSAGTAFSILTFGVRTNNTFSTINGNGQEYTANYTATGLTLVAEQDAIVLSLVDTTLVGVGRQATLSVTLPFAAPPGGVTATVTSLNTNLLTVAAPGTIAFAQGQTVGQIQVNGVHSQVR